MIKEKDREREREGKNKVRNVHRSLVQVTVKSVGMTHTTDAVEDSDVRCDGPRRLLGSVEMLTAPVTWITCS